MSGKTYTHSFSTDPGGWHNIHNNFDGPKRLEIRNGLVSRSPWWVDYNHAPPGAGYLHMLYVLPTKGPGLGEAIMVAGGRNGFIEGGFPTDFTNASLTFRLQGEIETRGANLVLLINSKMNGLTAGWALTGSPLRVLPELSEQTIRAVPDPSQWTCLGGRHDRQRTYGKVDLDAALRDVNGNIMLILFPLNVVPMGPLHGDPHLLRAGKDYPVWMSRLPEGYVVLNDVRIEFP
ncbi:MAG: hypothetical protein FJW26_20790 [Acidimicrobiia bacterium]|nr:hypothetical protein [Acidimicrobiia bacterium]